MNQTFYFHFVTFVVVQHDIGVLPFLMQLPPWCCLGWGYFRVPFAQCRLHMRSRALALFSQDLPLCAVATPIDQHLVRPSNWPPGPHPQTQRQADTGTPEHMLSSAPGLQLFPNLGNKSSRRASPVSCLMGTSTNNAAAAKEEMKLPGPKRRCCLRVKSVEPDVPSV